MTRAKPTDGTKTVRDELTPELTRTFRYIYGRLFAKGRKLDLKIEDAEEYAMEGVLHALERRHQYRKQEGKPLESWLLTVAYRRFIDATRRKTPVLCELDEASVVHADASQHEEFTDRQAALRRQEVLQLLPAEDRRFFLVWAEQFERTISREVAARRCGLTIDEYEARKKKLRRLVLRTVETAGYRPEDLCSGEPRDVGVKPVRDREA